MGGKGGSGAREGGLQGGAREEVGAHMSCCSCWLWPQCLCGVGSPRHLLPSFRKLLTRPAQSDTPEQGELTVGAGGAGAEDAAAQGGGSICSSLFRSMLLPAPIPHLLPSPVCLFCRGGAFLFSFAVPSGYPHDPPKVKCLTKVYHPNIDLEVRGPRQPARQTGTGMLGGDPVQDEECRAMERATHMRWQCTSPTLRSSEACFIPPPTAADTLSLHWRSCVRMRCPSFPPTPCPILRFSHFRATSASTSCVRTGSLC